MDLPGPELCPPTLNPAGYNSSTAAADPLRRQSGSASALTSAPKPRAERADRVDERAREARATLERQLADERGARQAAELNRGQAQTALKGEQQLRVQLEKDLTQTQRRLDAAEKARDAAIKSLEQSQAADRDVS